MRRSCQISQKSYALGTVSSSSVPVSSPSLPAVPAYLSDSEMKEAEAAPEEAKQKTGLGTEQALMQSRKIALEVTVIVKDQEHAMMLLLQLGLRDLRH